MKILHFMKILKYIENHEISDYFIRRICENFNFRVCVLEETFIIYKTEFKIQYLTFLYNNKRVYAYDGKFTSSISCCVGNFEGIESRLINFKSIIINLINRGFNVFGTDDGNLRIVFPNGLTENEIMMKMKLIGLMG